MEKTVELKSKQAQFTAIILVLQVALYFTIFFDFQVARQIIGFLYLTFVPGFIILQLLNPGKLSIIEIVLFSLGLSISFMMLAGLAMNVIGPVVGIQQPLGSGPLILGISCFATVGALLNYLRNPISVFPSILEKKIPAKSFLFIAPPILTVIGAFWANSTGNTSILLLALVATVVAFATAVFFKELTPTKLYAIIVFTIALTLIFQFTLASNQPYGFADINIEYYVSKLTQNSGYWNSTVHFTDPVYGTYYDMLSLTILPIVYSNVLKIEITWVFKIVYPLIFAFVPLALYFIWREKFGATIALFSAFLFMSQVTFYTEMLTLERQMIGELFFVLLFIVLFSKKLSSANAIALFVIFGFSLILSHYSLAVIFLFLILATWLFLYCTKKTSGSLNLPLIILFSALMFSWYIYTSASTSFETMLSFANYIYLGLGNFFNPASRGAMVLRGIGLDQVGSSLQLASRIVAYATEFFIVIGYVALLLQTKRKSYDLRYFILCSASMVILALCILLPNFALSLQITRFYHILLFFLAPLFSFGCIACFEFITKNKKEFFSSVFIVILLATYFLFQTNFIYEIAGSESWSVPLSKYRLGIRLYTEFGYSTNADVSSAEWLSQYGNFGNLVVYTDNSNSPTLFRFIYRGNLSDLMNTTSLGPNEFVYLGELNTLYGIVMGNTGGFVWNTSEISALQYLSGTYTNGYCQVYENTATP